MPTQQRRIPLPSTPQFTVIKNGYGWRAMGAGHRAQKYSSRRVGAMWVFAVSVT